MQGRDIVNNWQMRTPVAFLVFNRIDTTEIVFEAIRRARPPKLLVVADGPRKDKPGEFVACEATRAIIGKVDWPCEVLTNFSDMNMGCRQRISSGLNWVFSQVEEAIILEDDCLPSSSFFRFCEELLERHRFDERICMISGDNFQFENSNILDSYYYSRYSHIWGWASWRRSWARYDVNMALYPEFKSRNLFPSVLGNNRNLIKFWRTILDQTYAGEIDTWDHQLSFANFIQNGLCIMPHVNLVSNIGFGANATKTKIKNKFAEISACDLEFPLKHPPFEIRDARADSFTENEQMILRPSMISTLKKVKDLVCVSQ